PETADLLQSNESLDAWTNSSFLSLNRPSTSSQCASSSLLLEDVSLLGAWIRDGCLDGKNDLSEDGFPIAHSLDLCEVHVLSCRSNPPLTPPSSQDWPSQHPATPDFFTPVKATPLEQDFPSPSSFFSSPPSFPKS